MQPPMQSPVCKNCEQEIYGNFCSNCGQKAQTVRLNWGYLQDEAKYTFLHINKGLLYTSKQLLTRPGQMVREFLDGKRVQHYKPILFIFVLAGLNGLLNRYLHMERYFKAMTPAATAKKIPFQPIDIFNWITNHYALFELMLLPLVSLCSWLAFRKWGYNYVENIIINSYASGLRLLFGIIIFPIQYCIMEYAGSLFMITNMLFGFVYLALTLWIYIELYKGKDLGFIILRILLMGFYFFVIYLLIIIGVIAYFVVHYKLGH